MSRQPPFTEFSSLAVRELDRLLQSNRAWTPRVAEIYSEYLDEPAAQARLGRPEMLEVLEKGQFGGEVYGLTLEDLCTRRYAEAPHNLVDELLRRRAHALPPLTREYLMALRDSAPGVYEVIEVRPGEGITVRDLLLEGAPIEVVEVKGSGQLLRWDRIGARIVTLGGITVFTGALFKLPESGTEDLMTGLGESLHDAVQSTGQPLSGDAFREQARMAAQALAPILGRARIGWMIEDMRRPAPALHNRDGDPIELIEAAHAVAARDRKAVIAALDSVSGLQRTAARPPCWDWAARTASKAPAASAPGQSFEAEITSPTDPDVVLLASLRLSRGRLVVSVNSRRRLARVMELVGGRLQCLIGPAELTTLSLSGDSSVTRPKRARRTAPKVAELEAVRGYYHEYYRKWLDEPIPALGGRTPREAAKDYEGRARLVPLLKELEKMQARGRRAGGISHDVQWIWRELGIEDLRR